MRFFNYFQCIFYFVNEYTQAIWKTSIEWRAIFSYTFMIRRKERICSDVYMYNSVGPFAREEDEAWHSSHVASARTRQMN